MTRTVFVDRDGTLNVDQVRRVDVARLELRPNAAEAVRAWKRAGWRVVVITNQSGIARGNYTASDMRAFHAELEKRLGAPIDAWYHCPHMPDAGCACRKPGTLLLQRAAADLGVDLASSFMVGDSWMDVGAGDAVGARTVLVPSSERDYEAECRTGMGRVVRPSFVARDLLEAARWTLAAPEAKP